MYIKWEPRNQDRRIGKSKFNSALRYFYFLFIQVRRQAQVSADSHICLFLWFKETQSLTSGHADGSWHLQKGQRFPNYCSPTISLSLSSAAKGLGLIKVYFVSPKCLSLQVAPRSQFRFSWAIQGTLLNANLKDSVQILIEITEEWLQSKALKTAVLFRATMEGIWYICLFSIHELMTGFL